MKNKNSNHSRKFEACKQQVLLQRPASQPAATVSRKIRIKQQINPTLRVKSMCSSLPIKKFGSQSLWKVPSGLIRANSASVFIASNNKRSYILVDNPRVLVEDIALAANNELKIEIILLFRCDNSYLNQEILTSLWWCQKRSQNSPFFGGIKIIFLPARSEVICFTKTEDRCSEWYWRLSCQKARNIKFILCLYLFYFILFYFSTFYFYFSIMKQKCINKNVSRPIWVSSLEIRHNGATDKISSWTWIYKN